MAVPAPMVTNPRPIISPRPNDRDADNVGGPNDSDGVK